MWTVSKSTIGKEMKLNRTQCPVMSQMLIQYNIDIQFAFLKSQAIRVFNPEKYANITAMTDNIIEI